jgi:ADP-ribose pyrophosphatase YjhB (NUDIX family)
MHHAKVIRFCPYCGTPTVDREVFGKEHASCPSCGWIHFADPKVAAAALLIDNNRVLLTKRIYEPNKGSWTLPAGFVDAFEDPANAVVRECLEETGLDVEVVDLIDVMTGREHDSGADIVLVYRVKLIGGHLFAGDDADQAEFFHLDKLPLLAFKSTINLLIGKRGLVAGFNK